MTPHRRGQSTLPILEGSNAHSQFGAKLSLGESIHRAVLKKDLGKFLGRIPEGVRIHPYSPDQKMAKGAHNPPHSASLCVA